MSLNLVSKDENRIFGLDLLRTIAILWVVKVHGGFLLNNTRFENFPYIKMIDGVDLFFVLSGFLIGKILLELINSENKFELKSLLNFWKRRWFRTLPNYYLILIINVFVVKFGIIHEDISKFNWKFFFFLQNFSSPLTGFFWESWSISIEEWFYLTVPILLFLALKILQPKRAFLFVTLFVILFSFFYRISISSPYADSSVIDLTFRHLVLTRLDSLAFGLLAIWVNYFYHNFWNKFRKTFFLLGMSLIFFLIYFKSEYNTFYRQVLYFSISPISVMFLLPFLQSFKLKEGFFHKTITHISKISYSMYLINLALIAEILRDNFSPKNEIDGIVKYILYWCVVVIASTFLYRYFELPVMKLRDSNNLKNLKQNP